MKTNPLPTAERLREILDYDKDSGTFLWKKTLSNAAVAGRVAGGINTKGYRLLRIDGGSYKAARIAWAYVTGCDPGPKEIDHINRIRCDDRFDNLRLSDRTMNCRNIGIPRHNTSGAKGVSRFANGRWCAYIYRQKERVYLGTFQDFESAHMARLNAEATIFGSHGIKSEGE